VDREINSIKIFQNLINFISLRFIFKKPIKMGVTRLKRKEKRNRANANARVAKIKQLTKRPVIKNVDIEKIKEEFAK
jgi:hypothetical protein